MKEGTQTALHTVYCFVRNAAELRLLISEEVLSLYQAHVFLTKIRYLHAMIACSSQQIITDTKFFLLESV